MRHIIALFKKLFAAIGRLFTGKPAPAKAATTTAPAATTTPAPATASVTPAATASTKSAA
ncbi:hypothetical protein [Bradyrhizobium sp. dw_78]|uniref:hypothetical protein n=1 Tax=Bradyrhizobium sp. dw_78 TaxID=2719793 RepID=UPI001BD551D6|nr:hypothetical protein [Bradyrhizobium sp. dw_78]